MQLGLVSMPEEILSALQDNSLVVFTGAGISIDPPSKLPAFMGLALSIVDRVQSDLEPESDKWRDRLDSLLGELDEDPNLNIHKLTKRLVTEPTSKPNANHEAIMRIVARGTPRVVSTNYDMHLSTVANSLSLDIETYRAPALPLATGFSGLVYLHGAADGPAERLIVTDRDFGQAYLRQAWATRFLTDLFGKFTVLFVGYSHSDVVMRYLGLALGRDTSRYVLTSQPNDPMWTRLGITTIDYPAPDGDHSALTECLRTWAQYAEMGRLDHRQRIRSLVEATGALDTSQKSYLEASICRPDRVQFFCRYAKDRHWLEWAATQPVFRALFSSEHVQDQVSWILAGWFAEYFATASEQVSDAAWDVLTSCGGEVSLTLWAALAMGLSKKVDVRPAHHRRWFRLLIWQDRPGCNAEYLEYALVRTDPAAEPDLTLELFAYLIQPQVKPKRGSGMYGPTLEVQTRGSRLWLTQILDKAVQPLMPLRARDILAVSEAALKQHYILEETFNGLAWDPFSRQRRAIQPHSQDGRELPLCAVIDAARDSLTQLALTAPAEASGIAHRWLNSRYALFRRLALHFHATAGLLSADAKVDLVIEGDLIVDRYVRQEMYELLRTASADLSDGVVSRLLEAAKISELDEYGRYLWFQVLAWLRKHGSNSSAIADALSELTSLDPGLQEEEHPGFGLWTSVVTDQGTPPMETEAFHERVLENPAEAVAFVRSFKPALIPREEEPRDGLLDGLILTGKNLDAFDDSQRRRWAEALADIALTANPEAGHEWVDKFTATVGPDRRSEWIEALSDQFRELPPAARERNWQMWLHDYWARRNQDDPVVQTSADASALAKCVPWLSAGDLPGAVDLVESSPAALTRDPRWLRQLPEDFLNGPPRLVSSFFVALIERSEPFLHRTIDLAEVLRRLVSREGDWGPLKEAALRMDIEFD